MNLDEIKTQPKEPNQQFVVGDKMLDFKLVDFWKWGLSDLIENRNRGVLAEFIVKQALEVKSNTRLEWDAFDLETEKGIKIEVKSAAYIQVWQQNNYSKISFGIAPTKTLLDDNNYSDTLKRHADVYVFCLLHHEEQETINPMNLNQWTFYLVKTATLDEKIPKQKSITLSSIKLLEHEKCSYSELKEKFHQITKEL